MSRRRLRDQRNDGIREPVRRARIHAQVDRGFDELVRDIATVTLKYDEERRTSPPITTKRPERAD